MSSPAPQTESATYTVAVRALCEFTARTGDLDLRFTPAPTAQEGIEGHLLVTGRRGAGYQAELPLSGQHGRLTVRGRADGYDPARQRLEEIKTFKGDLQRQPANHRALHWAQLRVYGALFCAARGLPSVDLALVYFDIGSQQETVLIEHHEATSLQAFFEAQCEHFMAWAEQEARHRQVRDEALQALRFPHADFRVGQRPLSEAVYKAAVQHRVLLAQAPTGIGKTVGTLFPLLKACPGQGIDKVFFLSAKSSGRALALEALDTIAPTPAVLPLRVLELVARDKACVHPDKACHGESCPLAQGFYDRLPAARSSALALVAAQGLHLDHPTVQQWAAAHQVCPYYLSQELAKWADVVIGDYNYYFDVSALLHVLAQQHEWRVGVLVDEAHNLVERGRKMYSAELSQLELLGARHDCPPAVKPALDRLHRAWLALTRAQTEPYLAIEQLPERWLADLQKAVAVIGSHFADHPAESWPTLQGFYLDALHFMRMAESFDQHSLFDISLSAATPGSRTRPQSTLCVRNVLPAPFLRPRLEAAHTVTLFSATVQPASYFQSLLGLPERTVVIDVDSPFQASQLAVHVAHDISTRYADRAASMPAIVDRMSRQFATRPGNYLAFFSSHDYLQDVARLFESHHPDIPVWKQARGMSEADQQAFLARFTAEGQGIGFAVLGGSFSEGVDLPGQRLIGAFVATLGLPQVNPVNDMLKARLDELLGQGYNHAYLYPGLQKVVQAAGRVIRTTDDQGVLHLMDDRYQRRDIRALLPRWWALD